MICFIHIPRTGGSTIHSSFYPSFGPDRWRVLDHPRPLKGLASEIEGAGHRNWYVGGHFGISEFDAFIGARPEDFLFTVVRDPAERIASLHRLLNRSPGWLPQANQAVGRSVDYFYDLCLEKGILPKNSQCLSVGGHGNFSDAAAALSRYSCLGSMADFPGFIKILESEVPRHTGVGFEYLNIDHNAAPGTGFEVTPALRSRIEHDFADDFMLVAEVERRQEAMLQSLREG